MQLLLTCAKCRRATDLIPQLARCGAWEEDGRGRHQPLFSEFASTSVSCQTPGCDGVWTVNIRVAEWQAATTGAQPLKVAVPR